MLGEIKPVITVKQARKILKGDAAGLSDDDILALVRAIETLADYIWSNASVLKTGMVK